LKRSATFSRLINENNASILEIKKLADAFLRLLTLSIPFSLVFSPYVYGQELRNEEEHEEEYEFLEPIFHDTATDLGGEKGELEINYMPGLKKLFAANSYQSSFEIEYVLFENFGIEIEMPLLFSKPQTGNSAIGVGDVEIETQYTFLLKDDMAMAGGLEFEFPTGDEDKGFGEGAFGIGPFITYLYETPFNLSFHASLSAGFEFGEKADKHSTHDEEEGIMLGYNGALLYGHEDFFFGMELNGEIEKKNILLVSPQVGVELGSLTIGTGIQIPVDKKLAGMDYNFMARLVYEFEVKD